jgi:glycyl-tRNA synthetase beta subunit
MMTNITQRPITNQAKDQRQEDELRQAILDKKQEQIKDWSNHIEHLQQTLESVSPMLRIETEKRVTDLTDARDQAFAKVESLKPETQ